MSSTCPAFLFACERLRDIAIGLDRVERKGDCYSMSEMKGLLDGVITANRRIPLLSTWTAVSSVPKFGRLTSDNSGIVLESLRYLVRSVLCYFI